MKIGIRTERVLIWDDLATDGGDLILTEEGQSISILMDSHSISYPIRFIVKNACAGHYIRWYFNGWHYWFFLSGENVLNTEGENYRTIGSRSVTIGSGQLTLDQVNAIRTILNTGEVYLFTNNRWENIRIEPGTIQVFNNQVNGYEIELQMITQ